jgi:CubicO group peptidase (beta-lactamase class C family)
VTSSRTPRSPSTSPSTAGLPSDRDHAGLSRRRAILAALRELDPLDRPGRAFSYSNLGYVLAGHLIETVTGMTWWEAMEVMLLRPLGVRPAFVVGPVTGQRLATGHSVNRVVGRVRPVRQSLAPIDAPAGAIAASAADLVTLGRLLAGVEHQDLIRPDVLARMRRPAPHAEPFGVADGWALGLAHYRDGDRLWVGHDGTADGTSCHLRIEPESGTVVALTCNGSTGFAMWHELVLGLRGFRLRIGDYHGVRDLKTRLATRSDESACLGGYRNGEVDYEVRREGAALLLSVDGELYGEITLYDGLVFAVRNTETGEDDQTGRFLRDHHGRVGWIQVGGRLARRRALARDVA